MSTTITPFMQAVHELEVFGFTLLDAVLNPDEVKAMREALIRCERQVDNADSRAGASPVVANLPTLDSIFFRCIDHPRILPLLEHFLGKTLILGSLNARIVRPGDPAQDLHSDIPADMLNMTSPVMMNTVWLLDDFSVTNGATRIVPGSHKSGLDRPPKGFTVPHEVQLDAPAGSVLMFNGQTWHAGGGNTSEGNRHALFGHYRKHMLLFQCDPHDAMPHEWYEKLTGRQRELLRMRNGVGTAHASDNHLG